MLSKWRSRERETLLRGDVAQDQQDRIRGRVVGAEELLHVAERGGVQIGEIAVEIVRVGPIAESDGRHVEPGKAAVGLVEHVDADFFLDDVALVAQIFVVHFQRAHAIGFEPQHAIEGVRGHRLVVVGDVVVRRAIEHAAGGIDQLDVHHFSGVLGALKHHVLEQVREAAAAARLEAKSDVVVDADGDDRSGAVRRDHHAQAVCESRALDWNVQWRQGVPLRGVE